MDRIAIWECWANDGDRDGLVDYFYDALWFLKRCGDETLSLATVARWWDEPEDTQPHIQASFQLGIYGALVVGLPGNRYRRAAGLPLLTQRQKRSLLLSGWLAPSDTGYSMWTLPQPNFIDGFVRRWAQTLAETCVDVFEAETRHLLIEFARPTPEGAQRYVAPLPFMLDDDLSLYV